MIMSHLNVQLKYVPVTYDNIIQATEFQMKLFPDYCGFLSYEKAIKRQRPYFLVYNEQDQLVGTAGVNISEHLGEKNTAWLGWYGVDPNYRKMGYGKQILLDMFDQARAMGCDTLRLYTSAVLCPEAMVLYHKMMDFGEPYELEEKHLQRWVFTKSLIPGKSATTWGERSLRLDLEEQRAKESLQALQAYREKVAK